MEKIKKSLSSNFFLDSDKAYELEFAKFQKYGISACDFQDFIHFDNDLHKLNNEDFTAYLKQIKKSADKYGISIFQCHGAWPSVDDTEQGRKEFEAVFEKEVFGASILGCKYIVYHPCFPFGWGVEKDPDIIHKLNVERYTFLSKLGKKYNVNICLENMPFINTKISYTNYIVKLLDEINEDNLFICFDVGHANCLKENIYESVKMCGNRLGCIHVHDNMHQLDLHLPPRFGSIDFDLFHKALKEINFKGTYNLEIGNISHNQKEEKAYMDFLNSFMDEAINKISD